jgi:hypothetical protein
MTLPSPQSASTDVFRSCLDMTLASLPSASMDVVSGFGFGMPLPSTASALVVVVALAAGPTIRWTSATHFWSIGGVNGRPASCNSCDRKFSPSGTESHSCPWASGHSTGHIDWEFTGWACPSANTMLVSHNKSTISYDYKWTNSKCMVCFLILVLGYNILNETCSITKFKTDRFKIRNHQLVTHVKPPLSQLLESRLNFTYNDFTCSCRFVSPP